MSARRQLFLGLGFVVVASILTLAAGEAIIRFIASRQLIYNIEMVRYARELKMRSPKGNVSHIHRPSSRATLMGVDVSLNSLGNRGPERPLEKPASTKRVLILGSSITMGWGVPYEKVFSTVTEELLNTEEPFGPEVRFEMANAGIGNYNTHFQYELFKEQYPKLKPDMVVLHYFLSDVQPRGMGRDNPILKHSYLAAFFFDRWSRIRMRFTGEVKDLFTFYNDLYRDDSAAWIQTRKEITEMREAAARDKIPFLLMIVPDIHDLSPNSPYGPLYARMETAFQALGISTINTFQPFQERFGADVSQLWIQSDDPHPNASGHILMADILYRHLTQMDPLGLKGPR